MLSVESSVPPTNVLVDKDALIGVSTESANRLVNPTLLPPPPPPNLPRSSSAFAVWSMFSKDLTAEGCCRLRSNDG